MPPNKSDAFSDFDVVLTTGEVSNPWGGGGYEADLDMLRQLLALTLGTEQRSGRTARAVDAWIAYELRRAGFPADAVWPRTRRPRILPAELAEVERAIDEVVAKATAAEADGSSLPPRLRRAIRRLDETRLGESDAYILGDFYAKQVDVTVSSWRRGPEVLVSTKTMFSSYRNNFRNRHEEAVGEVSTLRRRHPMAAMGFVYVVRSNIYSGTGDYALLQNILSRLRRPAEAYDATMLLVLDWQDEDPAGTLAPPEEPHPELSAGRFFANLLDAHIDRTPIGERETVRLRRDGEPERGGAALEGATEVQDVPPSVDEEDDIR